METIDIDVQDLVPHEKNPRVDAAQVEDLATSIREHGIQVPLVAAPQVGTEQLVVLAGHRRLTAALQLGITEVPVHIREDLQDAREQLAFMATENIHRDQLTAMEESRLFQDMLDLGWSQAAIALHTALPKKRVSERARLAKLTEQAGDKVHRGQISIEDALVIAEYSDDPEAAEQLETAVGTYNFDWEVSRAKQRRERAEHAKATRKEIRKAGGREADDDADFLSLSELFTDDRFQPDGLVDGEVDWTDREVVDAFDAALQKEHASCPGHCARVTPAGAVWGCDQADEQHPGTDTGHTAAAEEPEPAPESDPWDEISEEEFAAARIHREQHLAKTLPHLDVDAEARAYMVGEVLKQGWPAWGVDGAGVEFLQGITGVEGKAKIRKVLTTWPLAVLVHLFSNCWDLKADHRYMAEGRQGSSYWGERGDLRQLLEATGYQWSEPEQRAILLATGKAHDAPADDPATTDDAAALAEGGEAA